MRKYVVLIGLALLATGAAAAGPEWVVQIGVHNNTYPGGGDDPFNFFGVLEGCSDDYPDARDVIDPGYPNHAVALIFRGDQNGNNPTYPQGGLAWDIREPFCTLQDLEGRVRRHRCGLHVRRVLQLQSDWVSAAPRLGLLH